jgi:hypothetical protein
LSDIFLTEVDWQNLLLGRWSNTKMQFLHSEGYESVTTSTGAYPLPHNDLQNMHLQKQSVLFVAALQALSHRAGNDVVYSSGP